MTACLKTESIRMRFIQQLIKFTLSHRVIALASYVVQPREFDGGSEGAAAKPPPLPGGQPSDHMNTPTLDEH